MSVNDERNLMPGDRVLVFDSTLFRDDKSTPLSTTMRPATVVQRYGYHSFWHFWSENRPVPEDAYPGGYETWKYPDLVAVSFDHRPEIVSWGHFTYGVKEIQ